MFNSYAWLRDSYLKKKKLNSSSTSVTIIYKKAQMFIKEVKMVSIYDSIINHKWIKQWCINW